MKKKTISLIVSFIFLLPIFTFTADSVALGYEAVQTNKLLLASNAADEICNALSENIFGGTYIENGKVYINIVENAFENFSNSYTARNTANIIYKPVKFSLAELQNITDCIFDRLQNSPVNYDVIIADANDVTNMVDIEIRPLNDEIYEIAAEYIDLEYVNVTLLPNDFELSFTTATEPPEVNVASETASSGSGLLGTIYPGMVIRIGSDNHFCTTGPRYNSSKFYTCGHAPCEYFNPYQTVYINHPIRGYIEIGTTGNVICGDEGDSSIVTLSGIQYSLPSTNGFPTGTSTYSYKSGKVGDSIEMHGTYSGLTTGTISAINQTATVGSKTIKNLSKASYTCKNGDSGAAVFSRNITTKTGYCYGIQSLGANYNSSGGYYATSYFSAF